MTPLPLAAESLSTTHFEWGRIQTNSDWILPITVCLAVMFFVRYVYRRDAEELGRGLSWGLTALRMAVFYGLLVLYLEPQWRSVRETTRNSRVVLLADTSLSMRQTDAGAQPAEGGMSRAQQLAQVFAGSDLLARLRQTHDVAVLRFDQDVRRVAGLEKRSAEEARGAARSEEDASSVGPEPGEWANLLEPTGTETRLGQALRQVLQEEQGGTLAGVVLFTDGGQNSGLGPEVALQAAREAKVPLFAIGLGSDRLPANVRVSDLTAPPRAYPGDRYTVTGYLQAQKLAGRVVSVELLSRESGDGPGKSLPTSGVVEGTQQVTLGGDGEVVAVAFDLVPERTGRRTLALRVQSPPGDHNPDDNQRETDVEIVDRKNRVLLVAGGPSREYQFLRSVLFRDRSSLLDLLLQTAQPGISQDCNQILDEFPETREEMFSYDCVVAIDPDWQALSDGAVELLEKWVAEQAGGLIVMAGPVHAGKSLNGWVQDPRLAKTRALYPVEFQRNVAILESGMHADKDPWPLDFTREGLQSEFLWLGDTAAESQQEWSRFPGVYAMLPVRGPKPGATVLARFSDPRFGQAGQLPVYFAGQFYGSGRVFYIGSPEMWRLRSVDEGSYERFYTKLIRHVSQGRLLRGSSRGVLLVGQDHGYLLGSSVDVRAQLTNSQLEPLDAPNAMVQVLQPDGTPMTISLQAEAARPGTFAGHFTAGQEGTYRLELPLPDNPQQRLTRRVQVKLPDLELENPQRNDALLSRLARGSGGKYYIGPELALADGAPGCLWELLKDRTKKETQIAAPDPLWEQTWLRWMMYALCGLLCLEWLIRRLWKLA